MRTTKKGWGLVQGAANGKPGPAKVASRGNNDGGGEAGGVGMPGGSATVYHSVVYYTILYYTILYYTIV